MSKRKSKSRLNQKNTPKFWKKIRNISLVIAGIGGSLLAAPVALPAAVITGITLLTTAATAIGGTAALTRDEDQQDQKEVMSID